MDWLDISNGELGSSIRGKLNSLAKASAPLIGTETLLFALEGADLDTTADQVFTKIFDFDDYIPVRVIAVDASTPVSAATGGIYTEASKGGAAIVAASQAWSGLTSPSKVVYPAIPAAGMAKHSATPFLSLTTPMGAPATCNFYILGFVAP